MWTAWPCGPWSSLKTATSPAIPVGTDKDVGPRAACLGVEHGPLPLPGPGRCSRHFWYGWLEAPSCFRANGPRPHLAVDCNVCPCGPLSAPVPAGQHTPPSRVASLVGAHHRETSGPLCLGNAVDCSSSNHLSCAAGLGVQCGCFGIAASAGVRGTRCCQRNRPEDLYCRSCKQQQQHSKTAVMETRVALHVPTFQKRHKSKMEDAEVLHAVLARVCLAREAIERQEATWVSFMCVVCSYGSARLLLGEWLPRKPAPADSHLHQSPLVRNLYPVAHRVQTPWTHHSHTAGRSKGAPGSSPVLCGRR